MPGGGFLSVRTVEGGGLEKGHFRLSGATPAAEKGKRRTRRGRGLRVYLPGCFFAAPGAPATRRRGLMGVLRFYWGLKSASPNSNSRPNGCGDPPKNFAGAILAGVLCRCPAGCLGALGVVWGVFCGLWAYMRDDRA